MKELETKIENYIRKEFLNIELCDNIDMEISENKINNILTSGKFRKYPLTCEIQGMLSNKINYVLENDERFIFVPSFGGYKHYWLNFPNTEWAELFNLKTFIDYLKPLYLLMNKKIEVEYLSKDIIVPLMNNIPKNFVKIYLNNFKSLINLYNKKQNFIEFRLVSSDENYDKLKMFELLKENIKNVEKEYSIMNKEEINLKLKKANNNFCWNGIINYNNSSIDEKEKILLNSKIINEAFLKVDSDLRGGSAAKRKNAIPILFRKGVGANNEICLNMCSCQSSTVAFWVGMGILEIRKNKIIPRIISRRQYEQIKNDLIKVNVNIKELKEINKNYNYNYIYVYSSELNFKI